MLNEEKALELARRLTVVSDFPMYSEAIEAIAEDLVLLTETAPSPDIAEARARWLVTEIRRTWTRWSGTVDMVSLYQKRFNPPVAPSNQMQDWGSKPPIQCRVCKDSGVIKHARFAKNNPTAAADEPLVEEYIWCNCPVGIHLHLDLPDWLDVLNRLEEPAAPQPPEPAAPPHPAVEKPVSSEVEKHIAKAADCPACASVRPHTHQEYWQHHTHQEIAPL